MLVEKSYFWVLVLTPMFVCHLIIEQRYSLICYYVLCYIFGLKNLGVNKKNVYQL